MAEYIIHMDEAVQLYGANNVINAVDFAAHGVQHASTSWGVRGRAHVFNIALSDRG